MSIRIRLRMLLGGLLLADHGMRAVLAECHPDMDPETGDLSFPDTEVSPDCIASCPRRSGRGSGESV